MQVFAVAQMLSLVVYEHSLPWIYQDVRLYLALRAPGTRFAGNLLLIEATPSLMSYSMGLDDYRYYGPISLAQLYLKSILVCYFGLTLYRHR